MDLGQLFITGISGLVLTDEEAAIIKENNLGGVILFANNYSDPAQLTELTNSIKELKQNIPFFISVDHEGGRVQRFKNQFTHFPAMYDLAQKLKSPKKIFEVHEIMAKELFSCGINLSFSPCSDIWTNEKNKVIGDRSFGNTTEEVEKFTTAAIRGLHAENVLACSKHFPGHGMTTKDSHFDLPIVTRSLEDLRKHEFLPFKKATRSKINFIMMAHLLVDAIDTELPTSLSSRAYDLLRTEIGFDKIIISDDMEMKAIADRYSYGDAALLALNAGCDIMLYRSMETMLEALTSVKKAYQSGKLDKAIYKGKIDRIIGVKTNNPMNDEKINIVDISEQFSKTENSEYLANLLLELNN